LKKAWAIESAEAAWNRRAQSDNARPPCYLPEKDNPYPLCIGRGMTVCAHCCLWADYDQDENESRVNHPLTLDELRGMDGDKILIHYIGQCEGFYADVIAPYYGRDEQYIGKDNGKLTAVYLPLSGYGVGWFAYRRKPEGSN